MVKVVVVVENLFSILIVIYSVVGFCLRACNSFSDARIGIEFVPKMCGGKDKTFTGMLAAMFRERPEFGFKYSPDGY